MENASWERNTVRAVGSDVRRQTMPMSAALAGKAAWSSRDPRLCAGSCGNWAYDRFKLKLIISTCSGAPERSPVAAGDQARSQGLAP